jgi:hypothetical protein
MATGNTITTSTGQTYNYDDVVNLILSRYAEGKTPALAVKSALQLGFPEDVIRTLPGVDAASFEEGKRLIQSGAFTETAAGTMADIQQAAPVGSAQYNARIAAGLDAFGFPPEEVARLTAAGLYGPGRQDDPGIGGLFTQENRLAAEAEQVLLSSGKANDPRFADSIVGTFVDNGVVYNVQGDGSFTTISETPDQVVTTTTFTPAGQEVGTYVDERFKTTNLDRFLEAAAYAALAAGTAAGLGPAGVGLFGTPGAAAAGAGTTNLIRTGSVEDALKAAALANVTAYGLEGLMGGGGAGTETVGAEDLSVYDDIRQLKAAGIPDSQIANIIETSYNVTPTFAADAINQVTTATAAPAATETVTLAGERLFNPATLAAPVTSAFPSTFVAEPVTVQGQNLPQSPVTVQDLLAVLTPELVATLPAVTGSGTQTVEVPGSRASTTTENIISSLVPATLPASVASTGDVQQIQVQGQKPEVTIQDLLEALTPSLVSTLPAVTGGTQVVEVPGTRATTTENIISSIVPALTAAAVPAAAQAVTQPAGTQSVEVTAKKDTSLIPSLGAAVTAALPALPAGIKAELPKPMQPPAEKSLFSPSDILKLIGLLGGAGAGAALSNTGTGTISTPPSDTMIGSTTPQFGPDYYAAVQRYYNAYMPETPRNVATPLQQWYENKFGA